MRWGTRASTWAAIALGVAGCALAHADGLTHPLAPQPLADALDELASETGLQIIYSADLATGVTTPGASAGLDLDATLRELLRGTGLTYERINARAVTLVREPPKPVSPPMTVDRDGGRSGARHGAHGPSLDALDAHASALAGEPLEMPRWQPLQQVIVTGSHIPGAEPVGATLIEITRSDIQRSGYSTVQDVIRSLPQNFNGGPSGGTHGHIQEELSNFSHAEGVNLRGLGAGSTLILLDGRRLAPGAGGGRFVDVSAIPVSAIERIEILPEGASAIYGADAVGGVINIILREDYRGAETQLRFGTTTGDGPNESLLAQTFGIRWGSGNGLLTVEYWRRGDLLSADRAQSADSDLESLGGGNFDTLLGNPGTILIGSNTWAIPRGQDGRSLTAADLAPGTVNLHDSNAGTDVLPSHERWSVVGTLRQELGERSSLFADATYSSRRTDFLNPAAQQLLEVPDTNPFYVNPTGGRDPVTVLYGFGSDLGAVRDAATVQTSNLTLGARAPLGSAWTISGYLDRADSRERVRTTGFASQAALAGALADPDPATAFDPFGDGSFTSAQTLAAIAQNDASLRNVELWSADLSAQGVLLEWRGRPVELAIGSDWRYETLRSFATTGPTIATSTRLQSHTAAVYGELRIPLAAHAQASVAGRYESYASLGSAFTPRLGLDWSPVAGVTLKGSWGRSFKAPDLTDLDESINQLAITVLPDPKSPTGSSPVLLWTGGNAGLRDETATTWTAGLAFRALAGRLTADLTYFNIDFVGRIERIDYSASFLEDPIYAALVTRDPTAAERQNACSRGLFIGASIDCTAAPVAALVDMRLNNVASTRTDGLDFATKYRLTLPAGELEAALGATWLLAFDQAQFAGSPSEDLLDTTGNPIDWRIRGALDFRRGPLDAAAAVNFFDSYRDTYSNPDRRIGSWTTVDLQVSYDLGKTGKRALRGTSFSVAAQNLFNTPPPFVNNPAGVGYDPENADLLGRVLSVTLRKTW